MNGLIALVGSGEYLPVMEQVDRYLLGSLNTNGRNACVVCLPTAAGNEGDQSVYQDLTFPIHLLEPDPGEQ